MRPDELKALRNNRAQLGAMKSRITDEMAKLTQRQNENAAALKDAVKNLNRLNTNAKANLEKLETSLLSSTAGSQYLLAKFQELDLKDDQINAAIDKISRAYDQTVMGAYIKDKVGALLNSDVFCNAAHECPKPKISPSAIEKELFPNTGSSTRRSSSSNASH